MTKIETLKQETKNSTAFPSLEAVAEDFLSHTSKDQHPDVFVCAIAGAAYEDEIHVENLPQWPIIHISHVKSVLGIPEARFINDLVAAA